MKYTEIFKLKEMLEKANIPFEFIEHNDFRNGYQICYPKGEKCVCSVIEHSFSYGSQNDLLEIQGLMTKKELEETHDTVLGYLSAENVFERIKEHYQKQNLNDNNSAKDCQYDDKEGMAMSEKVEKQLREQIEKMKCCSNCKNCRRKFIKENVFEHTCKVEHCKNYDKWELIK